MKVLLRSIKTGLFYEEASKWTPDQTAALDFEKTTRAVELVFAARLENVEMLLSSVDPQFDLILPIKGPRSLTDPSPSSDARSLEPPSAAKQTANTNQSTRSSYE